MRMYDIIRKKKDGYELTNSEIEFAVNGYTNGTIPDYQMSALLMAICINSMTENETAYMTKVMSKSGKMLDLSDIDGITVDKHSTGGVGDKTTLIVAPIAAACGAKVAKMSGRGLGFTGGTIDKLMSVKGFNVAISLEKFKEGVNRYGLAIVRQLDNLVPADKKIYGLRDVTATVDSIPLIASSIMSKKIALGAEAIVLDVKYGSGAFMKNYQEAEKLAKLMCDIGEKNGRRMSALITDMDVPLGNAIGNSLEVIEAMEILNGAGPCDLRNVCIELSAKMLETCELGDYEQCVNTVEECLNSGKALEKFYEWMYFQGAEKNFDKNFKKSKFEFNVKSETSGVISAMNAEKCGEAAVILGAGRDNLEDEIDYGAGIVLNKKTGDYVSCGDTLATFYTDKKDSFENASDVFMSGIRF